MAQEACAYCGCSFEDSFEGRLTVDHIIPLSRGGTNGDENLCAACYRCNRAKAHRTPEEWKAPKKEPCGVDT